MATTDQVPKSSQCESSLTDAQRAQIERSRQRALLRKQERAKNKPYTVPDKHEKRDTSKPKVIDTGGGFLLDVDEDESLGKVKMIDQPGALLDPDLLICEECENTFPESYLYNTFGASICDKCRDEKEKHRLITRTEAKNQYLLKDCDFDIREPPLKFILRKNPRNPRWGDMKLYLELQVAQRAQEIWKSDEALEEEKERRNANKGVAKQRKYDKKVKELRKTVRSSLWRKDTAGHEHQYGEETYNEEDDDYSKTCTECGHVLTFEKM